MAKPESSAAVLEPPEAGVTTSPTETMRVVIIDPSGVVLGDAILRPGTHEVPRHKAAEWIAAGRARPVTSARYLAAETTFFHDRLVARGEVCEFEHVAATGEGEPFHGRLIPLNPGEPAPATLPAPPGDEKNWRLGPRLRVEVLVRRRGVIAPGVFDVRPGDVVEVRECHAVPLTHHGVVRPLEPLSAIGREVLALFRKSTFAPSYERVAATRRRMDKAAPTVPPIRVKVVVAGTFAGVFRNKGEELDVSEADAVVGELDGRFKIAGKATERMIAFARKVLEHRANFRHVPFPNY